MARRRDVFQEPEEEPRPLRVALIPGGFSVRGKELYASLKGTRKAVKFTGIVVDPYILRELARIHPLLEVRPGAECLLFQSPNGRHRIRIRNGAGVPHKGALGYAAEIKPTVRISPCRRLAAAAD